MTYSDLQQALTEARYEEKTSGEYRYVLKVYRPEEGFVVEARMPLMGEWYSADGRRHG